jgi:hypothetical protein
MLQIAQSVRGKVQITLPHFGIDLRPAPLAFEGFPLLPQLLRQLLDEAVAIVGRAPIRS